MLRNRMRLTPLTEVNKRGLNEILLKYLSTTTRDNANHSCKVLVVGGGSGGCSTAAKLSKILPKKSVIVLEPSDYHYYQPFFTLIGGGTYDLSKARKPMGSVLPKNILWIKDYASEFNPKQNTVTTKKGDIINYEYLLIAVGLQTRYDKVPGLIPALERKDGVCSNYSAEYVDLTYKALKGFKEGNAIFTYPNTAVKCPGAPQKICYIAEEYFRKRGLRNKANVKYFTSLPVIFGVKTYADALWKVANQRNIEVKLKTNLIEIRPDSKEAIFENLDKSAEKFCLKYSLLHVTPPMCTPDALRSCKDLVNAAGFVDVNKHTMQSTKFCNVFAIGDCTNTPNSKTAAAAGAQCAVIFENMKALMNEKPLLKFYDGYASCPLVTGYSKCILAEFDYSLTPLETFPFRQDREMRSMYLLKKYFMPQLYWNLMLNGYWNGPAVIRNIMHLKLFNKKKGNAVIENQQ